jgi:hypothetical protein
MVPILHSFCYTHNWVMCFKGLFQCRAIPNGFWRYKFWRFLLINFLLSLKCFLCYYADSLRRWWPSLFWTSCTVCLQHESSSTYWCPSTAIMFCLGCRLQPFPRPNAVRLNLSLMFFIYLHRLFFLNRIYYFAFSFVSLSDQVPFHTKKRMHLYVSAWLASVCLKECVILVVCERNILNSMLNLLHANN